jgi:L-asparagine transporter-like permease
MKEIFTKILTVVSLAALSVWLSVLVVEHRLSERQLPPVKVAWSVTNYVTLTNYYVTVTNFVPVVVSTNETSTSEPILSPGIPFIFNTQSVIVTSIDPPTEKTGRLRQISEELKTILEDLKEKEKK